MDLGKNYDGAKNYFFQSQQKCVGRGVVAFSLYSTFNSTAKYLNYCCFNNFIQQLAVPGSQHFEWYLYPNVLGLGSSQDLLLWGTKVQVCSPNTFSSNFPTNFSGSRGNLYLILQKLEANLYFFSSDHVCTMVSSVYSLSFKLQAVLFIASESSFDQQSIRTDYQLSISW